MVLQQKEEEKKPYTLMCAYIIQSMKAVEVSAVATVNVRATGSCVGWL